MPLVGNIQDFGLSDFLYLVDRGYKTGCLYLNREDEQAVLFFDKGRLIYASPHEHETLSDVLMRIGSVSSPEVTQSMPPVQLQSALQPHVEEYVYTLFGWGEGEFLFEHGQKPNADAPILPTPIPVENLIMEGVRRIDEWGRIKDRIPSTDLIPRFLERPSEKAKGVKLSPEEWRVFARINGKDSLATVAQSTGLSEFDVCRVVYGFLTAGLVEVVKRQRIQAETRSAAGSGSGLRRSLVSRIIARIEKM
ncbi:MAG: DUF4388 domain-containing protein [Chloroflexaceae bacterium]|nr:DUF4388 domain-containing protein [Chloroflexaceae bacterium]